MRPRRFSSIPHARPVGPAPTMTASSVSTSEHAFHSGVNLFEGCRKRGSIFAPGLGHVRATAAFAADSLGHLPYQLAGVNFGGKILRDRAYDGDLRVDSGSEHHHGGLPLVAQ